MTDTARLRELTAMTKCYYLEVKTSDIVALLNAIDAAQAACVAAEAERDDALAFLDNAVSSAPEPLVALGSWLADHFDEDEWPTAERFLNAAVKACHDNAVCAQRAEAAIDAERAARVAAEADASAARKRVRELVDEVARLQAKVTELAMDRLIADSADLILNDVKPEAKP